MSVQAVKDSIRDGKSITLVGNSFDLLHVGHVHLLERSKRLGAVLVACVLSDVNVSSYKGSRRPIISEQYRGKMVDSLQCVDRVFILDIDTSHPDVLSVIQPDNVIFGIEDTARWRATAAKRESFFKAQFPNISIHYLERFTDSSVSTSDIIRKIINSQNND
jgi:cytidyltransferase-like protein